MKKSVSVVFFLAGIIILSCYYYADNAEEYSFKIEGSSHGIGITSDERLIFADAFFTMKCFFEPGTPRTIQRLYSQIIESYINIYLRNFMSLKYLSQFSLRDVYFCQTDFYNAFMDYISDRLPQRISELEELIDVQITRLEIIEEPFTRNLRLQYLGLLE